MQDAFRYSAVRLSQASTLPVVWAVTPSLFRKRPRVDLVEEGDDGVDIGAALGAVGRTLVGEEEIAVFAYLLAANGLQGDLDGLPGAGERNFAGADAITKGKGHLSLPAAEEIAAGLLRRPAQGDFLLLKAVAVKENLPLEGLALGQVKGIVFERGVQRSEGLAHHLVRELFVVVMVDHRAVGDVRARAR